MYGPVPSDTSLAIGQTPQQERVVADILTALGSTQTTSGRDNRNNNNNNDCGNIVTITVVSTQVNITNNN